jgi:hypothetical protein
MLIDPQLYPWPAIVQSVLLIVACIVWVAITVHDGRP